jgi:hypothetical protein
MSVKLDSGFQDDSVHLCIQEFFTMSSKGEIILYQDNEGEMQMEVHLENETVWLSLMQLAELFRRDKSVISRHIRNIYKSGELNEEATVAKIATVQKEGERKITREIEFYNLDMIISVGYRVNSKMGVRFRMWATNVLKEFLVKGFVIDDDRLAGTKANYFDELLERVRKIRTSESNFYDKVKAIFSTSIDYESGSNYARQFYATVQNKFHYAITGQTAAEIVVSRVDSQKHEMGLMHRKGEHVTRQEAEVAKNYLEELELRKMELLADQFLSYAELRTVEQKPMYMQDWLRKLDDFIVFNEKQVLTHAGKVSHQEMQHKVKRELAKYNQRRLFEDPTNPQLPAPAKKPKQSR